MSCLLMHMAVPFVPLGLEKLFTGHVEDKSLCLFVAMYAIAIGITSSSRLIFAISLTVGLVYSAGYGWLSRGQSQPDELAGVATWVLAAIVLVHSLERYNRHVVDRAPFWEFRKVSSSGSGGDSTLNAPLSDPQKVE